MEKELKKSMVEFVNSVHTGRGQDAKRLLGEIIAKKYDAYLSDTVAKSGIDAVPETKVQI